MIIVWTLVNFEIVLKVYFLWDKKNPSNFANISREKVNCFVDYFSNIVNDMKSIAFPITNFVWCYNDKKQLRTKKIFHFLYISTAFVERELRHLNRNKATGTDSQPPNLLKDCSLNPSFSYFAFHFFVQTLVCFSLSYIFHLLVVHLAY